jgi:hypothetical protein
MTDRERKINANTVIEDSSSEEENIEEEPIPRLEPAGRPGTRRAVREEGTQLLGVDELERVERGGRVYRRVSEIKAQMAEADNTPLPMTPLAGNAPPTHVPVPY